MIENDEELHGGAGPGEGGGGFEETGAGAAAEAVKPDMPHADEAEQAILAAVLDDNAVYDSIAGRVTADFFAGDIHRAAWELIAADRAAGERVDFFSLARRLREERIGPIEGLDYLTSIVEAWRPAPPGPDQVEAWVAELANVHAKRELVRLAQGLYASALSTKDSAIGAIRTTQAVLEGLERLLGSDRSADRLCKVPFAEEVPRLIANRPEPVVSTGLRALDALLDGGFARGTLVVVAGRPGMGKSTFGVHLTRAALAGHGVAFATLEMSTRSLVQRTLSMLSRDTMGLASVPYHRMRGAQLTPVQTARLTQVLDGLPEDLPIAFNEKPAQTPTQIGGFLRRAAASFERQGRRLDVAIVDYLGLVRPEDSRYAGKLVIELGMITSALRNLAKDLGITVVLLHQLNRGVESRESKRPLLSDLRDSGAIEQDADTVLLLYRPAYYAAMAGDDPEGALNPLLEIIVAKNRSGETGIAKAHIDLASSFISDST